MTPVLLEKSSTLSKLLSNSIAGYGDAVHERKRHSVRQTSPLSHFKDLPP